jgi:hypothetical protein
MFFCKYNIFLAITYQKNWQQQVENDTIVESNQHVSTPWTLTTLVINLLTIIIEGHFQLDQVQLCYNSIGQKVNQ